MTKSHTTALKIAAVLWVIWGLVHLLAGVLTMAQDATGAVQGIADATAPDTLVNDYAPAVGALINQHGWNLAWIGVVTALGGVFIWRANLTAIWVTAMIGGLTDIGYFLFMDLGGYVHFFPGTVMTMISGTAVLLSAWVWFARRPAA